MADIKPIYHTIYFIDSKMTCITTTEIHKHEKNRQMHPEDLTAGSKMHLWN